MLLFSAIVFYCFTMFYFPYLALRINGPRHWVGWLKFICNIVSLYNKLHGGKVTPLSTKPLHFYQQFKQFSTKPWTHASICLKYYMYFQCLSPSALVYRSCCLHFVTEDRLYWFRWMSSSFRGGGACYIRGRSPSTRWYHWQEKDAFCCSQSIQLSSSSSASSSWYTNYHWTKTGEWPKDHATIISMRYGTAFGFFYRISFILLLSTGSSIVIILSCCDLSMSL